MISFEKKPSHVSYSAISTHESCNAQYYFGYVRGIRDEPGEAASRGTRLHTSGELYLAGQLEEVKLPADYWRVKGYMRDMRDKKALSEQTWTVGRDWKITNSGVFIKCIVDVHWYDRAEKVLHVTDLKTGKIYTQEHTDQLQLYGTVGLCKFKQAKEVRVGGLYIDQGRRDTEAVYPRKMLPHLIRHWTERAMKVLEDKEFKPNPSPENCKWCSYNGKKGGPCASGV